MAAPKTSTPRRYDSPVRRQQAVETRERIVEAGCTLLRRSGIRDWRALTIRGVAQQAGVNERTIYRYFGNERGLRDAVMHRLEEKAGIELEGMQLEDVADFAARVFAHVSAYPGRPKPPLDPTLSDANVRQKHALRAALADRTSGWTHSERTAVAALLDVFWSVATYERLVMDWEMDRDQAIETVSWAIGLVEEAVRKGQRPGG
ncbi:MAG TPA: TetR/AcrR family transcriptional regulator [Acidimicrobiales bacterium]